MTINPTALKADVSNAVNDVEDILGIADELPLPPEVKNVLVTVHTVLGDVAEFLDT